MQRNVFLYDHKRKILAGFWQYGRVTFKTFDTWLHFLLLCDTNWSLFDLDENPPSGHGRPHAPDVTIVSPGSYILLDTGGRPVHVSVTTSIARPRIATLSSTDSGTEQYQIRTRERDGRCLLTGTVSTTWRRLAPAHIFPRVHGQQWRDLGYPDKITDTAPLTSIGGPTKIDSIQNVIMLRNDLHSAWDNYEFGVDPDDDYRITAFISNYDDLTNTRLDLSHIVDPTIRPLDDLFRDHFLQGLLKQVKSGGEPTWDEEEAMGDAFDLSRKDIWGGKLGQEHLELQLADRLFDHRLSQEAGSQES